MHKLQRMLTILGGIVSLYAVANVEAMDLPVSAEFVVLDQNQDGLLEYKEYVTAATEDLLITRHWRFYESDRNDDDQLTEAEFCSWSGGHAMVPRRDFMRRDVNHDGKLTLKEFQQWSPPESLPKSERDFHIVDFDGNDSLSLEELGALPAFPFRDRGSVPDPVQLQADQRISAWEKLVAGADKNADGQLAEAEWPIEVLKDWGPIGQVAFAVWDANRDGTVTSAEGRHLIEMGYGIRRTDGELIRLSTGLSVDWVTMRRFDKNGDGQLSKEEFVTNYWAKERNEELFKGLDVNGDGMASIAEIRFNPVMTGDVVGHFLWWDKDFNGRLDQKELLAMSAPWQQGLSLRVIPAFDTDGDGELSLMEYRATPLANPGTDWYSHRQDANTDGELSFGEFYIETAPMFVGLYSDVFAKLDLNHDGRLTIKEFEFAMDVQKAPPGKVFAVRDRDGNLKVSLDELLNEAPVADADAATRKRLEFLQRFASEIIQKADRDADNELNHDEYVFANPERLFAVYRDYIRRDLNVDGRVTREEYVHPNLGTVWEQAAIAESVLFDLDDDGVFSWKEFSNSPPSGPSPAQRFVVLDINEDQKLSVEEYLHIIPKLEAGSARLGFIRKDSNEDGWLSAEEWHANAPQVSWTREFKARDTDGDGKLNLDEFLLVYGEVHRKEATRNFCIVDFDADEKLSREEFALTPNSGAPLSERGTVPDPVQESASARLSAWTKLFVSADKNSDGVLTEQEWPVVGLKEWGPLGQLVFAVWDANRDGAVSSVEGQNLIENAYGIRRPNADSIRLPTGLSVDWATMRRFDKNGDGQLSKDEFVADFWHGPQKNEEFFKGMDVDGDGQATLAEISAHFVLTYDVVASFLWLDGNWNGRLDSEELATKCGGWQRSLAQRVIPAFDIDRDGELSFLEYRMTPLANPGTDWYFHRQDADADGELSFNEFYSESAPMFIGQYSDIFAKLDLNHDGRLTINELEFTMDVRKAPADKVFAMYDRNRDQRVTIEDLFVRAVPAGDPAAISRHERLRKYHQDWIEQADSDHDGSLSREEFVSKVPTFVPAIFEGYTNLDTDGDGQVKHQEYVQPTIGSKWEEFANAEALLFDVNDDGFLSWKEYLISPRGHQSVELRFEGLDANGDDYVSEIEYLHVVASEHRRGARREFCHIDADGDGLANSEEWFNQGRGPRSVKTEFRARDDSGDNFLTVEEFIGFAGEEWHAHFRRDFQVVDRNQDQRLSLDEFRCVPAVASFEDRGEIADSVIELMERPLKEVLDIFHRRDRDSDDRLKLSEWPDAEIKRISADLESIPTKMWDRDHDGYVTATECRRVLELVFGVRLLDDSVARLPVGYVVDVAMFRRFDANKDGQLSQSEFVSKFWLGHQKNSEIFVQRDKNKDGQWDWNEILACPEMNLDVLGQFFWFDANLDGLVEQKELEAKMAEWQKNIGARLITSFCSSGDGRMNFQEFRLTPFANPVADWYVPRQDKNHDAKLSWTEFYTETSPELMGLYREYFNRFDLDKDGFLTYDELEFSVDLNEITPEVAFRIQDKDRDGKLKLEEVFTEARPAGTDKDALERYEMRLGAAETRFLADDANRDGVLDVTEFQKSREAALKAVERKTKALTRHRKNQPSNLPFIAFIVLDALVLIGAGWYVWKWSGRRNAA